MQYYEGIKNVNIDLYLLIWKTASNIFLRKKSWIQRKNRITFTPILEADNLLLGFTSSQMKRNFGPGWMIPWASPIPDLDDMWMRFWTESWCWIGLRLLRMLGWDVGCIFHVRKTQTLGGARGQAVMDWTVSHKNSYVEVLTASTSECDFIWN